MDKRILIFDPVAHKGGSKKVIQSIISMSPSDVTVFVVSNDRISWQEADVKFLPLCCFSWLMNRTSGMGYFVKQFVYSLVLLYYFIRFGKFSKAVGISGPVADFSLYLAKFFIQFDVVQLVQGDVPVTRLAGYGLTKAKVVFYLTSTEQSLVNALRCINCATLIDSEKYQAFDNSVDPSLISIRKRNNSVGVLWAASLLPWKRLDLFVEAFKELALLTALKTKTYFGSVCFIVPTTDEVLIPNLQLSNVSYYQDPNNLDEIRSTSSIFVSTSIKEPFGLSILESMVAGLAIIIPKDNSYWDRQLTHGVNCLKFEANDSKSLYLTLLNLINDNGLRNKISNNGQKLAQRYTDTKCYSRILKSILK